MGISGAEGVTPSGTETSTTDFTTTSLAVDESMTETLTPSALHIPPSESVATPVHIPVTGYIITKQEMMPTIDGIPVDVTYGQVTDIGLCQAPMSCGGNDLAWGGPQDPSILGGTHPMTAGVTKGWNLGYLQIISSITNKPLSSNKLPLTRSSSPVPLTH
ncbi:hypothetical protein K505DRAFT_333831 [Melanomma pulvis-pyrius CBS 109.77]|uniref:Uncharacterized protein n=1 Tax=Melanomma pulvis-pyrius CBS 109.77 TaxID=1314802 RepID=A0A6A6XN56_9PLEO|nr:hypothetical protein K505DRAFT_333831 [Melanomma pulvis-pyrius CBS 109.77]